MQTGNVKAMQKLNFNKAKNLKSLSGMPQMAMTLNGWEVPLTLVRVFQDIVDGDLVTTEQTISFIGVWQPLKDEQLQFLPENQRSWAWYWIHAKSGTLNLNTADKIIFEGNRYKVMAVKDYSLNGYIEYQIIKDFEEYS
jgi:hypothetical protein